MTLMLELEQLATGAVRAVSSHPQSSFEVLRLNRSQWRLAPSSPGIYFLIGFHEGAVPRVYVGQSESDKSGIKGRLSSHRKDKAKFFGEIFVFPMNDLAYCRAVEAELIARAMEAESKALFETNNKKDEAQWQGAVPNQAAQIADDIQEALAMLLGRDLFSDEAAAAPSGQDLGSKVQHSVTLADLQEAGFLGRPHEIRSMDGGSVGQVTEDGGIELGEVSYTSLSKAASAEKEKKGQNPHVNGWKYWGIEREGKIVDLYTVREEFLAAK